MSGKRLNKFEQWYARADIGVTLAGWQYGRVKDLARRAFNAGKRATPKREPEQHWIISVQDSLNDYREVQGGYFDGTQRDAEQHFRIHKPWARYFVQPRYQITMRCNSVVLQWPVV